MNLPKHIHIIGICGVATSAIAIAFKNKGCKVTGSDKGFYPPVSTELEKNEIQFYAGWHPEKMIENGKPDFVIIGGVGTSPTNPEIIWAKENNIPIISFAEALGKYVIRKNSIVVTGTWGKTTISSLLSFILKEAGLKPSYFTGGLSLSHDTGEISDSDWSVVEGDEYQVSISDKRPKFVYYSPTHLLLTSVSWDHADLYPTEQAYFDEFKSLVKRIPKTGFIVACADDKGVEQTLDGTGNGKTKIIYYGKTSSADYYYHSIVPTQTGIHFDIKHGNDQWHIDTKMMGRFNAENITGCFAMAHSIGIESNKIIKAVNKFIGIKRRFEKRFDRDVTIFDCHAPTPEKAASCLETIREVYNKKIVAVYEPNIGGRQKSSSVMYDGVFKNADMVVIPRLTKLKVVSDSSDTKLALPMGGDELTATIQKTHSNVHFIEDDKNLVTFLKTETKRGDVIVFLGSHGFRGMIEEVVKKFSIINDQLF